MKNTAARNSTKFRALLFGFCLIIESASLALAQPGTLITDFKVGDWAQVPYAGGWVTVTIATPYDSGGYKVNYGPMVMPVNANAAGIRHYSPTAAELQVQRDTQAAMARRPAGTSLGAKFGTRETAQCPNRKGAITAATAKQYFTCDSEGVFFRDSLFLVTDAMVQVGSARAFNYNLDSSSQGIDTRAPVYDIRGRYTQYQCGPQSTMLNAFANTHNCFVYPYTTAQGRCWKDTFGDWHCKMAGSGGEMIKNQMPPAGF